MLQKPINTDFSDFEREIIRENNKLADKNLSIKPINEQNVYIMAEMQKNSLYPGIKAEKILEREEKKFIPVDNESRYRAFILTNGKNVYSVGHLRLRHQQNSQSTIRIFHEHGKYFLAPFSRVHSSDAHEIEIGGAVVNPKYQGKGIGTILMRSLTILALSRPTVISRTAKGRYSGEQMNQLREIILKKGIVDEEEILRRSMKYLAKNQDASTASVRMAEEFDMTYGGISLTFGGPFYYLEKGQQ